MKTQIEGETCGIWNGDIPPTRTYEHHITGAAYWEDGEVTMTTNCWRCGKRYEGTLGPQVEVMK